MIVRAAICLLALNWSALSGAEEVSGSVSGTVALEPMSPIPMTAQYRSRTRAPILDPEPPRAVVYLTRDDGVYPPPADGELATIGQRGYQFRPDVAAVRAGARVSFPNHDDEFHSVFSYSAVKRFDLGRYRKDEASPAIVFDQPGLVRVYCEIHKHMRGLLLVLETPWFTISDDRGRFVLTGVPPGTYTLQAFLPSEKTLSIPVTVAPGADLTVVLED